MAKIPTKPLIAVGLVGVAGLGMTGLSVARTGSNDQTAAAQQQFGPGMAYAGGPGNGAPGKGGPAQGGPGMRDLSGLAKTLGVDEDTLRTAMQSVRQAERDDRGQPDKRQAGLDALAEALDSDAATIQKALQSMRSAGQPPKDQAQGTTPRQGGGPMGGHGPGGHRGHGPGGRGPGGPLMDEANNAALVSALADATGKSEAQVKSALTKLQQEREAERDKRQAAFAAALAKKLGLDAGKVQDALEAARPTPPAKPSAGTPQATPAPTQTP